MALVARPAVAQGNVGGTYGDICNSANTGLQYEPFAIPMSDGVVRRQVQNTARITLSFTIITIINKHQNYSG